MLYIIQFGHFFKIGQSSNPERRFRDLYSKTQLPFDPVLVAISNASISDSILHKEYKEHRRRGEYFLLNQDTYNEIVKKYDFMQISEPEFIEINTDVLVEKVKILTEQLKTTSLHLESVRDRSTLADHIQQVKQHVYMTVMDRLPSNAMRGIISEPDSFVVKRSLIYDMLMNPDEYKLPSQYNRYGLPV